MPDIILWTLPDCQPCKILKPRLEKVAAKLGLKLIELDAQQHLGVACKYNVQSVPTVSLVQDGRVLRQTPGTMSTSALEVWIRGQGGRSDLANRTLRRSPDAPNW